MLTRTQALMISLGLGLIGVGALPGCAAYRKCGFAGCGLSLWIG
jgi:hypothetical protein